MKFVLLLFLSATIANNQICESASSDQYVYQNLYGDGDYNYTFVQTLVKLAVGVLKFIKEGHKLLAHEIKDTTPEFDEEYDFIVVGAGSAGSVIGARLSEIEDATVLLIEAGRSENLFLDVPMLVQYLQFSYLFNWQYQTEPSDKYCLALNERSCQYPRGRVMGGSSVLNYMAATRGHPLDYDGWAEMGNTGWSYDEVLPYFKKLEKMGIRKLRRDRRNHNTHGPLYISHPKYHTPIAEAFLEAGVELGYPIIDYNGDERIGYSYVQTTTKDGERWSANRAYLYPNHKRKNIIVSKNSHVDKVLIDPVSKQAYGVEFTKYGKKIRVKARKEIILSAGAVGSPKLLMLSGVGPSGHLKEMNISVIQDAPVGKNLMDHLVYTGLVFLVDQPVAIITTDLLNPLQPYIIDFLKKRDGPVVIPGATEGIAFINTKEPGNLDAYSDIEFFFASASIVSDPFFRYIFDISDEYWKSYSTVAGSYSWTIFPVLLHPGSRGEVLLRDADPKSKPRLIPNYFDDPEDLKTMIRGIRAAIEVSKTEAMQRYGSKLFEAQIPRCGNYTRDSDDYWECAARAFSNTLYHQSGTCKMAPENDPTGVVNPRLQVNGIKGLRVADASIMPTIISGHTNVPTIMIGEKLADMVKEDWGYEV